MELKHLLVHVDGSERTAERLALGATLARRFDARLTGLFAEVEWLGRSVVARRSRAALAQAMREAHAAFDAAARRARLSAEWWQLEPGEYAAVVGRTAVCCRYVDLAIFGQHEPENRRVPDDLVEQVLLACGRPLLVVPSIGRYPDVGSRVLVVWNGSREAARAVNDAVPLLSRASVVEVLSIQERSAAPGRSPLPKLHVVDHLKSHGIAAKYEKAVKDGLAVNDTILNHASDMAADLIVMGGYAQHGFPFLHPGANTRAILRARTAPVLLSF